MERYSKRGVVKNNISKFRKLRGWTQEDLSQLTEIDRTYISKVESGHLFPKNSRLIKLCSIFDCQIGDLYYIDWSE